MAGDRGFYYPQLTEGATRAELKDAAAVPAAGYYATGRTCEMALTHFSGLPYEHLLYLVYEASMPG
jgi:D-lactate dehydrogenase